MGNELTISAVITEINYEGCGKYLKTERHNYTKRRFQGSLDNDYDVMQK